MGFKVIDPDTAGFNMLIDGLSKDETIDCTLSGYAYTCATLTGEIPYDDYQITLPATVDVSGDFQDDSNSTGTYNATFDCSGSNCATVELLLGISFPCDFTFENTAAHE